MKSLQIISNAFNNYINSIPNTLSVSTVSNSTKASPEGLFDRDLNQRNRNNGQKLLLKPFRTSVAGNFFPIKIPTIWNRLPYDVVNCDTVNTFKNRLDKHWETNPPQY